MAEPLNSKYLSQSIWSSHDQRIWSQSQALRKTIGEHFKSSTWAEQQGLELRGGRRPHSHRQGRLVCVPQDGGPLSAVSNNSFLTFLYVLSGSFLKGHQTPAKFLQSLHLPTYSILFSYTLCFLMGAPTFQEPKHVLVI